MNMCILSVSLLLSLYIYTCTIHTYCQWLLPPSTCHSLWMQIYFFCIIQSPRSCRPLWSLSKEKKWHPPGVAQKFLQSALLQRVSWLHVAYRWKLGVDLEISTSSSFMSTLMDANKGVDRYRSPVSANMATKTDPSGAFLAISTAAYMEAPPEIPVKIPWVLANIWLIRMAASPGIGTYSS